MAKMSRHKKYDKEFRLANKALRGFIDFREIGGSILEAKMEVCPSAKISISEEVILVEGISRGESIKFGRRLAQLEPTLPVKTISSLLIGHKIEQKEQ